MIVFLCESETFVEMLYTDIWKSTSTQNFT